MTINAGMCDRFHDLADLTVANGGRAAVSIFRSKGYSLPLPLTMVERHPLGSQAFLPMTEQPFLAIVAPDEDGTPGQPLVFVTSPGQGVNYRAGTWHGVLTPLQPSAFFVVDRVGPGSNLEEHFFDEPYLIRRHRS